MAIDVKIRNAHGNDELLKIEKGGSAVVSDTGIPPSDGGAVLRPNTSLFANDAGATDMRVDGSTNSVDFYIGASQDGDRFIHTLAFVIADAQASFAEFGNLNTPLTNGCQLFYNDARIGDVVLAEALKTNFDFVQLANFEPTFGTGSDAFRSPNVQGASEAYHPVLDIEDVFGLRYGIKIPRNSNVRLTFRIRDDVSGVDRFDIRAYYFDRIYLDD